MLRELKPIIIFICTPSPFREFIIDASKKKEDFLIYESRKNFKVDYEIKTQEETNVNYELFKTPSISNNLHKIKNINDEKLLQIISSIKGEKYIILSGANFIKKTQLEKLYEIHNLSGIYNIHFGNCLTYRGLDSNLWASYHEDFSNIGISLHEVNSELDKGDLVIYKKLPKFKNISDLKHNEVFIAKEILKEFRFMIDSNIPFPHIENNGYGRYYGPMPSCLRKLAFDKILKNLK